MVPLIIIGVIVVGYLLILAKKNFIDKPQETIVTLKADLKTLQSLHQKELSQLQERLENNDDLHTQSFEFHDIVVSYAWEEISQLCNKEYAFLSVPVFYKNKYQGQSVTKDGIIRRFREAIIGQYKYDYLATLYPEIEDLFEGTRVVSFDDLDLEIDEERVDDLFEFVKIIKKNPKKIPELYYWKNRAEFLESTKSNLTAIPYMAGIMADYETYGIEHLAKELDWGESVERLTKVKSIRDIRKDAQAMVQKNKEAQYQLAYLIQMYPVLEEVIDAEFNSLPIIKVSELSEHDSVRDYLSKEEYSALSVSERNQLALDRYIHSSSRSKWQIGRDYELFVGYKYTQKGYQVDYFGSYMGLEDLGRDLIAKKGDQILIIQCKYWSSKKQIHENHIHQLFGTITSYCFENNCDSSKIKGLLVTNIELSEKAKQFASYLNIQYVENFETGEFPRIKCNIGRDENGEPTKIYHLPFDQQYDSTKIEKGGEFYAWTVSEAEEAGFRRAFRWFGAQ